MKMHYLRRDKKDEESVAAGNPFQNLDKTTVLQEARVFNETPINARKCCHILTKLLYILGQGEQINRTEATEAFFAVTKLWQSKDPSLRRLVFLAVKELSGLADDVIIVTSSLTKDMTGKDDAYRGAAVRALCKITDATMLQAIERYMKQAIVDKNPSVSSAAIVSSLHLMKKNPESVRRWVNEVQEAVNSDNIMVQYHALTVLYKIRRSDRLAVRKLVQKLAKQGLKSPYAVCFLIRLCARLIEEDTTGTEVAPMFDFIEACLRHKCEVVIYEAASALIRLPNISSKELSSAVSVLQLFCSSPKPTLRFAAVRALNKVAMHHPAAVVQCNVDLEQLISDQNRSIATLAITTLLKTGAESSIDRLMKQISSFVSEISDEFKIVVIDAIRSLCVRYPRKHAVMMGFLSTMLRDEGGYEYKKAIIDTIITIVEDNPDAKEAGLAHLCEFIEDCEHAPLATKILHLLGREGPKSSNPSKYIRFIYNRVILESAQVRAAAVSALAKFGAQCEQLRESISVLLQRCLLDSDDEVRDRATCALALIRQDQLILAKRLIISGLYVSAVGLEQACRSYLEGQAFDRSFDLKTLPPTAVPIGALETKKPILAPGVGVSVEPVMPSGPEPGTAREEKVKRMPQDVLAEKLKQIPELAKLGPLFKASEPVQLTESETEYVVHCTKLAFQNHLVFKFDCRNTVNDHLLDNVTVTMEPDGENWTLVGQIPCPRLAYNQLGETYTIYELPEDPTEVTASFRCTMKFTVRDCDPTTGEPDAEEGFPDEYALEDVELTVADHVVPMMKPNFQAFWDELGEDNHVENTYSLSSMKTLQEAVKNLLVFLGLGVCERSDKVGDGKTSHMLVLAGAYRGGVDVAARAKLALTADGSVTMKLEVRSTNDTVSQIIVEAIS